MYTVSLQADTESNQFWYVLYFVTMAAYSLVGMLPFVGVEAHLRTDGHIIEKQVNDKSIQR